jgi:hypothetical protein
MRARQTLCAPRQDWAIELVASHADLAAAPWQGDAWRLQELVASVRCGPGRGCCACGAWSGSPSGALFWWAGCGAGRAQACRAGFSLDRKRARRRRLVNPIEAPKVQWDPRSFADAEAVRLYRRITGRDSAELYVDEVRGARGGRARCAPASGPAVHVQV